ncbi:enoyl-CoA hydratase/isomerase family protein [Amycolatopsis thermalba]|uniref:Enoyl-CoA hydratase/isomerase family protein n=1 Tax=Amycolatopsis thermalba TaxID=944492 RepID=A0ABY4NUR6_9PSEU|nr:MULTISPECIES: enoyl-CoA hydratase/isomerase family protein [Amycolatopsis]UQS23763.1 enoyl-CoA hydratase/isomerase family protein [Amycolatopsis thermalba]
MYVDVEVEGAVATIRMDRPPLNVLNLELLNSLREAAEDIATQLQIKAVVLYGGSKVFSAGADIRELKQLTDEDAPEHAKAMQDAVMSVAHIPVPVIAAIRGAAVGGGCELALAADFRVCADSSVIGLPEILLGVIPTGGGTQRLTAVVGLPRAKEIVYSGRTLDAKEAREIGLADRVVPDDEVLTEAKRWAARYENSSATGLRAAKAALEHGQDDGLAVELENFVESFRAPDRTIGMRSFLEQGPGRARFGAGTEKAGKS